MKKTHIVVIGGGAAGTAAAHRLIELGYQVTIVEKGSQLGGRIGSRSAQGISYEMGASFITSSSYPTTFKLLSKLGLTQDLRRRKSRSAVCRSGKARTIGSLLGGEWLSLGAKFVLLTKLSLLLFSSRKLSLTDLRGAEKFDTKTVAETFTGKNQRELMEYLLQPILNGYFYWKPERTSTAMLMILLNTVRRKSKTYTLTGGLRQIPEGLAKGSTVLLDSEVVSVDKKAGGYELRILSDGKLQLLSADGVVCATTATVASKILPDLTAELTSFLAGISYSSTAVVARTYEGDKLTPHYALAYPRLEDPNIASISSDSAYGNENVVVEVVKTYGSGEAGKILCEADDSTILSKLRAPSDREGRAVGGSPTSTTIQRWHEALPEFMVGHIIQLVAFQNGEIEPKNAKLVLAGDYLGGPYIEGAITSGLAAADRLHKQF